MTPARWAQITDLFGDALEMRADERAAYRVRLKNEDPPASELVALLDAHERPGEFRSDRRGARRGGAGAIADNVWRSDWRRFSVEATWTCPSADARGTVNERQPKRRDRC